jgi:uncharacterized protein (DUF1778 family)
MHAVKRINQCTVRFDSAVQLESVKKAAKLKKWSLNRFMIEAVLEAADSVTTASSERLIVKRDPLPLNQ